MLTIKAEPALGDGIDDAAAEAVELANRLGCTVKFQLNDVTCRARPGGSAAKLVEQFHAMASLPEGKIKLACSGPPTPKGHR